MSAIASTTIILTAITIGLVAIIGLLSANMKAVPPAILVSLVTLPVYYGMLYGILPTFPQWASLNSYMFFSLAIIIATLLLVYFDENRDSRASEISDSGMIGFLGFIVATLVFAIANGNNFLPVSMNNPLWDETARIMQLRDSQESEIAELVSDQDLVKISPQAALLEAQGKMPGDVGSYASVGNTFEQDINGQKYYVTDLKVSNWTAYSKMGSLPGYFKKPARDLDGVTNFVSGHKILFAPDAYLSLNLDRHVYMNYSINCNCIVDHLDVLEIDDNGKPYYTGTVLKYAVSNVAMKATHVITVDPENGEIVEYPIEQAPAWIDRIYSINYAYQLVEYWATYSEWDATSVMNNTLGKMQIDAYEDVYGHAGKLYYMFTITSIGSDQTLKWEIRFDPKTGEAVKYAADGKTLQAVKSLIAQRTFDQINPSTGATPIECERQNILGVVTYYCLLASNAENGGSATVGYAFLQATKSSDPSSVVIGRTFDEAWKAYRLQLTQGSNGDANIQANSANLIIVKGTVARIATYPSNGSLSFLVTVSPENDSEYANTNLYFKISADNDVIQLTKEGDMVTVTAYEIKSDDYNDAISITNNSLP